MVVETGTEGTKIMEGPQEKGKQEQRASIFIPFLPLSNITQVLAGIQHRLHLPCTCKWHDIKVWPTEHNQE